MKSLTKILYFSLIFLTFQLSYTQTSTTIASNILPGYEFHDYNVAMDGDNILIAANAGDAQSGYAKVYSKTSGNEIASFYLEKGEGQYGAVGLRGATIGGNIIFLTYKDNVIGNSDRYVIHLFDIQTQQEITKKTSLSSGLNMAWYIDGYFYTAMSLTAVGTYDPQNSGLLPDLIGVGLAKFDLQGNVVWSVNLPADFQDNGSGADAIRDLQGLPNGNLLATHVSGKLVEFSSADGSFVREILQDNTFQRVKVLSDGSFEVAFRDTSLDKNSFKLLDSNGNIIKQIDWDLPFWNDGPVDWLNDGDVYHFFNPVSKMELDTNLVHGYKKFAYDYYANYNEGLFFKMEDMNSYIMVAVRDDGSAAIFSVVQNQGVTPATLNASGTNVISVHDGQRYLNGSWVSDYEHVATLVIQNGTMPSVGSVAPFDWVNTPSGQTLLTSGVAAPEVEQDDQGNKFVRFVFRVTGSNPPEYENLKVYLLEESALGVHSAELKDFSIGPNPVVDSFHIFTDEAVERVEVYNLNGQMVAGGEGKEVFAGQLSPGFYTVKVITAGGKTGVAKLVKE